MGLENFGVKIESKSNIRIVCHASSIKKFKKLYPSALFEIVMRNPMAFLKSKPHVLSPSKKLLYDHLSFEEFTKKFEFEIFNNPKAIDALCFLKEYAKKKVIFLVCGEKDYRICHRSLLKKYIDNLDMYFDKWNISKSQ